MFFLVLKELIFTGPFRKLYAKEISGLRNFSYLCLLKN